MSHLVKLSGLGAMIQACARHGHVFPLLLSALAAVWGTVRRKCRILRVFTHCRPQMAQTCVSTIFSRRRSGKVSGTRNFSETAKCQDTLEATPRSHRGQQEAASSSAPSWSAARASTRAVFSTPRWIYSPVLRDGSGVQRERLLTLRWTQWLAPAGLRGGAKTGSEFH